MFQQLAVSMHHIGYTRGDLLDYWVWYVLSLVCSVPPYNEPLGGAEHCRRNGVAVVWPNIE